MDENNCCLKGFRFFHRISEIDEIYMGHRDQEYEFKYSVKDFHRNSSYLVSNQLKNGAQPNFG